MTKVTITTKAGVKPWPRLFQNIRASCATDWVERFPAHVVAGWLGHSPMIAAKHYLTTRDAHFDMAAGTGTGAGMGAAAAIPATQARPDAPTADQPETKTNENPAELAGCGVACDAVEQGQWAQQDSTGVGICRRKPQIPGGVAQFPAQLGRMRLPPCLRSLPRCEANRVDPPDSRPDMTAK